LQRLQDAGVVGIRLNLVGLPTPDFASSAWRALLDELKRREWQVEHTRPSVSIHLSEAPPIGDLNDQV
jgi:predicted TIM-barrel fold metal-dependent hydrolase